MKNRFVIIVALLLCSPVIVKAQSFKWDSLGPRECYWTLGADIMSSLPSRLKEIRDCPRSVIDAVVNLFELKNHQKYF